jgi:Ca-activated chloride channel family protein
MGRHGQSAPRRRGLTGGRRLTLGLVVVLVVLAAASVASVRLLGASRSTASDECAGRVTTLTVGADPSATRWLRPLTQAYTDAHRVVEGRCVAVAYRELGSRQAEQALRSTPSPAGGAPPDVWIPESTTALHVLGTRPASASVLAGGGTPIAVSPIVLALAGDAVDVLRRRLTGGRQPQLADLLALSRNPAGWAALGRPEWGAVRFSTVDPGSSTLGASLVVAAVGALTKTPARDVRGAAFGAARTREDLRALGRSLAATPPTSAALFDEVTRTTTAADLLAEFGVLAVYEQDLWRYNGDTPAVVLQAVYPFGGQLAADYPFVVPRGDWVTAADRAAAADLRGWLLSDPVQRRLAGYGLRGADGDPGPELGASERGLSELPMPAEELKATDGAAAAQSTWRLMTRPLSLLSLVDVSGSMADAVPGANGTRLDVARSAAEATLGFLDARDAVGLWEFSRTLDGERDYRVLVPLGPVGGRVGAYEDRRAAAVAGYRGMRPRTATGLYDTVLAGFRDAVAHYRPGHVNTVLVLSDGQNEDPGSISLETLLAELGKAYDPKRPVHVVTLAYGADADRAVLARIARATDGLDFAAVDPRSIGQVFVSAVSSLAG